MHSLCKIEKDHVEEGDLRLLSSPQTLLHPPSHLELHRGSPPWGEIVSECKNCFRKTRRTKRRARAWRRPHMVMQRSDWLICVTGMMGLGHAECQVGQLWRSQLPLHLCLLRMRSPSKASQTQHWGLFLLAWIWPPLVKSRRKLQLRKLCSIKVHHSGLLETIICICCPRYWPSWLALPPLTFFPEKSPRNVSHWWKSFVRVHLPPWETRWPQHGTALLALSPIWGGNLRQTLA